MLRLPSLLGYERPLKDIFTKEKRESAQKKRDRKREGEI
jgi:hypothetical protein